MKLRTIACGVIVCVTALMTTPVAIAQEQEPRAVTRVAAPIYLRPDATLVPLVTLPAGRELHIPHGDDTWLRVQFQDPVFGRRTGTWRRRMSTSYDAP